MLDQDKLGPRFKASNSQSFRVSFPPACFLRLSFFRFLIIAWIFHAGVNLRRTVIVGVLDPPNFHDPSTPGSTGDAPKRSTPIVHRESRKIIDDLSHNAFESVPERLSHRWVCELPHSRSPMDREHMLPSLRAPPRSTLLCVRVFVAGRAWQHCINYAWKMRPLPAAIFPGVMEHV